MPLERRSRQGRPRDEKDWTDERIEQSLRKLIAHLGHWPSQKEFKENKAVALRVAVQRHGGAKEWAKRLGQPAPTPGGSQPVWTEARIRASLRLFLLGRESWPTGNEFREAGLGGLLRAMQRRGEASKWAQEFGFRPPIRGRPNAGG